MCISTTLRCRRVRSTRLSCVLHTAARRAADAKYSRSNSLTCSEHFTRRFQRFIATPRARTPQTCTLLQPRQRLCLLPQALLSLPTYRPHMYLGHGRRARFSNNGSLLRRLFGYRTRLFSANTRPIRDRQARSRIKWRAQSLHMSVVCESKMEIGCKYDPHDRGGGRSRNRARNTVGVEPLLLELPEYRVTDLPRGLQFNPGNKSSVP